jgi:hypothetical protein
MYRGPKEMREKDRIYKSDVTRGFADRQRNYQKRKSYIFGIGTLRGTRWRKISLFGNLCNVRITRRNLYHFEGYIEENPTVKELMHGN